LYKNIFLGFLSKYDNDEDREEYFWKVIKKIFFDKEKFCNPYLTVEWSNMKKWIFWKNEYFYFYKNVKKLKSNYHTHVIQPVSPTMSFTDLHLRYRDDYFWVGFDHFWRELRFGGSWISNKSWFGLKIEPPLANLAYLNRWNTLYLDPGSKMIIMIDSIWRLFKLASLFEAAGI
jgi:hypothetical protein